MCAHISANLLAKDSPVRDPTSKNAKNAKDAKKGLSNLFAFTRRFLRMVSGYSLDAVVGRQSC